MVASHNTKERDAPPLSWDREQEAEISSDLKDQAAANLSASESPGVMGKRFLGQKNQSEEEELPIRQHESQKPWWSCSRESSLPISPLFSPGHPFHPPHLSGLRMLCPWGYWFAYCITISRKIWVVYCPSQGRLSRIRKIKVSPLARDSIISCRHPRSCDRVMAHILPQLCTADSCHASQSQVWFLHT